MDPNSIWVGTAVLALLIWLAWTGYSAGRRGDRKRAQIKARMLAASAFSILLAFAGHRLDLERYAMGKEAFLVMQAAEFDKHWAAPHSQGLSRVGFWMGLAIPGIYEGLTLAIYAMVKPRERNRDAQDIGA